MTTSANLILLLLGYLYITLGVSGSLQVDCNNTTAIPFNCQEERSVTAGMNCRAAILPVTSALPENEVQERHRRATEARHKNISSLMTLLAGFLKNKINAGIMLLPVTDRVLVLVFVVAPVIYYSSLALKDEDGDPDVAEFMQMISLLSGPFALVLEVAIIFPAFGLFCVIVWIIFFFFTVAKSFNLIAAVVKRVYRSAMQKLVQFFDKLKDLFSNY